MDIKPLKLTIVKTNYSNIKHTLLGCLAIILLLAACKKKDDLLPPARLFRPVINQQLQSDGNWITASWMDIKDAASYTVQVSRDTFRTVDVTLQTDTNTVTFDNLKWNQLYQVQVRANAGDTAFNSKMSFLGEIKTPKFPTILNSPSPSDANDEAIKVSWTNSGAKVTSIKVLKSTDSSLVKEVTLTNDDITNQYKIISGLTSSTTYIIYLYSGTTVRGFDNYSTKAPLSGTIIDLRNIMDRPSVLVDTLPVIPSGSIVLLKRGLTYTVPSTYTFDKTVTIMSGPALEGGPARLLLTSNFDAKGTIDSLRFENIIIAKDNANYFMNVGNVAKIGKMTFEGCMTEGVFDNSFIRLKTAGDEVSKLYINNCIIDSFGIGARYAILYAAKDMKFADIEINNSTFYSLYYFIRQDNNTPVSSTTISNCTFNDMVNQGGYFINYTTFPSTFTINNSILGKTGDATNANGIKSAGNVGLTNTYATSDCTFSGNPITNITTYSRPSTELFKNPAKGDFTISDNSFPGKSTTGDPRWRP